MAAGYANCWPGGSWGYRSKLFQGSVNSEYCVAGNDPSQIKCHQSVIVLLPGLRILGGAISDLGLGGRVNGREGKMVNSWSVDSCIHSSRFPRGCLLLLDKINVHLLHLTISTVWSWNSRTKKISKFCTEPGSEPFTACFLFVIDLLQGGQRHWCFFLFTKTSVF